MNLPELAKSMNVSESDVLSLARGIVNTLEQNPNAKEAFMTGSEQEKSAITTACLKNEQSKMKQFLTKYNTNDQFRHNFRSDIFNSLKSK